MASIRKRRGRWQAQVRRGAFSESATFDTKAAAQVWARKIETALDRGEALGKAPIKGTVGDLLTAYELEARKIKPIGKSKLGVLKMLDRGLGNVPLAKLTAEAILDHARRRRQAGAGPVTVSLDISLLATVIRSAHALLGSRIDDTPVRRAREALNAAGLRPHSQERDRLPTEDELERLRAYWRANPRMQLPMADLMDFAAATGLRREEVTRLRWEDLDAATGTILVRDRKDPRRKQGNNQRIPLLFGALEIVLRQPRADERIFPVRAATISVSFPRACRALGIVDLRWHDLRHAAITGMFGSGMGIAEVALVSGHRTWAMLRRYTHPKATEVAQRYASRRGAEDRDQPSAAPARSATAQGSPDDREGCDPTSATADRDARRASAAPPRPRRLRSLRLPARSGGRSRA